MENQILQMEKRADVDLVGTIIEPLQEDQQNSKMVVEDQEEDVLQQLKTTDQELTEEDKTLKMKV